MIFSKLQKLNTASVFIIYLLAFPSPLIADDEKIGPALTEIKSTPCQGLRPFKNIDELLYQFYINLDSDCLFTTPVEELERIWQIDIEPHLGLPLKQLKRTRNDFSITTSHAQDGTLRGFYVEATEEYLDKYGSIFPDGKFPRILPKPLEKYGGSTAAGCIRIPKQPYYGKKTNEIGHKFYYWLNSDQTRIMTLHFLCEPTAIEIKNSVRPFIENEQ